MEFEWNSKKAKLNEKKHGVSFEEAISCFDDIRQLVFYDPEHSEAEDREIMIGRSQNGRVIFMCYTLRDNAIRIITARLATKREVKDYESGI